MHSIKKTIVFSVAAVLFTSVIFTVASSPVRLKLKTHLMKQLVKTEPLPQLFPLGDSTAKPAVIYVLGGSQDSLLAKFKTAADLYHRKAAEKILLFSNSGISGYDPLPGKNLTNTEWVIKQLTRLRVGISDIEFVTLRNGYFGTLTEAEGISGIAIKRGYKQIILVTSKPHSLRSWLAFSSFLKDKHINLYIYGSNQPASLRELVLEYIKLLLYKNVLLYPPETG